MIKNTETKHSSELEIRPPSIEGLKESLKEMMDMRIGKIKKNVIR